LLQPSMIDPGALGADSPFMIGDDGAAAMAAMDGAARGGMGFKPQYHDPSDDGGERVPDDVWASDDFQDKLWNYTREVGGPSIAAAQPQVRNFQFVRPNASFVFKTQDKAGGKVFVNICSSTQVPKPPEISAEMLQDDSGCRVRIPLSLGEPREDQDKEGKPCTVYDAIMHTDVVERATTEKEMKEFMVELCLQWIEQKHQLLLSRNVKFPKLPGNAKGEPDTQTIRRNTNQLVAEVGQQAAPAQKPEPVEEPEFAISVEDSRVAISIALPRLDSSEGVELEHSSRRLFLKAPGVYTLTAPLPIVVGQEGADAQFNKAEKVLTVWLAIAEEEHQPNVPTVRLPQNDLVTELD